MAWSLEVNGKSAQSGLSTGAPITVSTGASYNPPSNNLVLVLVAIAAVYFLSKKG